MYGVGRFLQIALIIVEDQTANERRPASPERLEQKGVGYRFVIKFHALIALEVFPEGPSQLLFDNPVFQAFTQSGFIDKYDLRRSCFLNGQRFPFFRSIFLGAGLNKGRQCVIGQSDHFLPALKFTAAAATEPGEVDA